jgi:hypothetical protein
MERKEAEGVVYPASLYDKGLLYPALVKVLGPLGGWVSFPFSLDVDATLNRICVTGQLVFDLTQLHEYIARFVLPDLCKAQEPQELGIRQRHGEQAMKRRTWLPYRED